MSNRNSRASFLMFLIGLGSLTKIFLLGCLSISELVVFICAPFVFFMDWHIIKKYGFLTFVWWLCVLMSGMLIASYWHNTPYVFVVKYMAVIYSIFAHYVVFRRIVQDNLISVRWYFVGVAFSGIITIFAFNPQIAMLSNNFGVLDALNPEDVTSGPLFWIQQFRRIATIPIYAIYMKLPPIVILIIPLLQMLVTLHTSESGRGGLLITLLGVTMMLMAGRSRRKMRRMGRHYIIVCVMMIGVIFSFKVFYSWMANNGMLTDKQLTKYNIQTERGTGLLSLIMRGRAEPFIGLRAALDNPILGYGAHPIDDNDYYLQYIQKYASEEDVLRYMSYKRDHPGARNTIPSHSHIIGGWVVAGLGGLLFWSYVLFVIIRHLRKYMASIPQLCGYYSLMIAAYLWNIFFSPLGSRADLALFVAMLIYAKNVGDHKLPLPYEFEMEARRYE